MKIIIAGIDGYLGWSLAVYLAGRGHELVGIDNFSRRDNVHSIGSRSITPIPSIEARIRNLSRESNHNVQFYGYDLSDPSMYGTIRRIVRDLQPDAIVHMAEMPSAPFSMIDYPHGWDTVRNNLGSTMSLLYAIKEASPHTHLVKLGTMGEYSYQGQTDIPEGMFGPEDMFRGESMGGMIFPRKAPSTYHCTKIQGTYLVEMASRFWGLTATDIMQGVVYGTRIPEMTNDGLLTRFDVDECFGTAINRFCAQAVVGLPITPYGKGHQKRGFLPLRDSMQCLELILTNPPETGKYRVFNQLEDTYDITELAKKVKEVAGYFDLSPTIETISNPRTEKEDHYYNPDHQGLLDLGYKPTFDMANELKIMFQDLIPRKEIIESVKESITPRIKWAP